MLTEIHKVAEYTNLLASLFPDDRKTVLNLLHKLSNCHSEDENSQNLILRTIKILTQYSTFGEKLRWQLRARKLSQANLAEKYGVSQPFISQLCHREDYPDSGVGVQIAQDFELSPD